MDTDIIFVIPEINGFDRVSPRAKRLNVTFSRLAV
jgi:hypothetical protein